MAIRYYIVPGLGNSDENHWQSDVEKKLAPSIRINQDNWINPKKDDWVKRLHDQLSANDQLADAILIGHSLGCITIIHWLQQYNKKVKAAILVAPADIENPPHPVDIKGFDPIPTNKLTIPSTLIYSTNDPWCKEQRSTDFANYWGSSLINIGHAGHINSASGYGEWNDILDLIKNYS